MPDSYRWNWWNSVLWRKIFSNVVSINWLNVGKNCRERWWIHHWLMKAIFYN